MSKGGARLSRLSMYSITENIYYSQLSSVAILLQPKSVSHRIIQGKHCVLSLSRSVLSSCRLPLPSKEARSYFTSTVPQVARRSLSLQIPGWHVRLLVNKVALYQAFLWHLLFPTSSHRSKIAPYSSVIARRGVRHSWTSSSLSHTLLPRLGSSPPTRLFAGTKVKCSLFKSSLFVHVR
jgi:hypothetical protein